MLSADVTCISVKMAMMAAAQCTNPPHLIYQLSLPRWFPKNGSGEWSPVRAVACAAAPIALKAGRAVRLI